MPAAFAPKPSDAFPSTGGPLTLVRHLVAETALVTRPAPAASASVSSRVAEPTLTAGPSRDAGPTLAAAVSNGAVVDVIAAAATPVAPPLPADPITGVLTEVAAVVNTLVYPNLAAPPTDPLHLLLVEAVRRLEYALGLPVAGAPRVTTSDPVIGSNPVSTADGTPRADDQVLTPYGNIGKWLLESDGQISDFGGQQLDGKSLLEPINIIIVDPTSTSKEEAIAKLNTKLREAGFPAQPIHSTGFQGMINGDTFGQQPTGALDAFSNNFFLLPDDHARAFGPSPIQVDGVGYVWTVAASRELFGLYNLEPTHTYLSYNAARDELSSQLIDDGATLVGIVPLSNAVTDQASTQTTGDHDGYAIVVQLNDVPTRTV